MSTAHDDCCQSGHRTLARRCAGGAGWVVPASVLVLMPKCPACVAGYVAVATGLGISVSAAAYVRTSALVLSVAVLTYLAVNIVRRRIGRTEGVRS